jgi:hypothetical protein
MAIGAPTVAWVRSWRRAAAWLLVAWLWAGAPAGAAAQGARCGSPTRIPQGSFQALGDAAPFAYVWVDDIVSRLTGGFNPFDVYVVTGSVAPPFQAPSGRMNRGAFLSLTKGRYGVSLFGPVKVSDATGGLPSLPFNTAKGQFSLRVVQVHAVRFGDGNAVTVQLCR